MGQKVLRVVHYLNQFFGGLGGEEMADSGPQVKEGPVGPGKAAAEALGNRGEVVGTVLCGDNYFAQDIEGATKEVIALIGSLQPDGLLAGPAFYAGRYGIACGAVCKAVQERMGLPAVTGMYRENPGVDLYHRDVYIVESETSARKMAEVVSKMAGILGRLSSGEKIGKPSVEGYFPRGLIVNERTEQSSAERTVDLLLSKIRGEHYETEVPLPSYDRVERADGIKDLSSATIALVTDGGLIPKGNPDKIETERATRFGSYDIEGVSALDPEDYEAHHAGYTPALVNQDPNRLVPVDVMRELEKEGVIGKLHNTFYSTSGCASILENVKNMGEAIAGKLIHGGVQGAILTST